MARPDRTPRAGSSRLNNRVRRTASGVSNPALVMRQLKRFVAFAVLALVVAALPASASMYSRQNYFTAGGVPTNASFVGAWIPCNQNGSIGFTAILTGTGAPVATWGVDVTNDTDPNGAADLGATALTLTADMTAKNPAGDSANINFLFMFSPAPPAKWIRFKYTRTSGGSASNLLKVGVSTSPPGTP